MAFTARFYSSRTSELLHYMKRTNGSETYRFDRDLLVVRVLAVLHNVAHLGDLGQTQTAGDVAFARRLLARVRLVGPRLGATVLLERVRVHEVDRDLRQRDADGLHEIPHFDRHAVDLLLVVKQVDIALLADLASVAQSLVVHSNRLQQQQFSLKACQSLSQASGQQLTSSRWQLPQRSRCSCDGQKRKFQKSIV